MFSNCNSAVETEAQRFVVSAFFRVFVCSKLGFWRQHHAQARLLFSMAKMEKGTTKIQTEVGPLRVQKGRSICQDRIFEIMGHEDYRKT